MQLPDELRAGIERLCSSVELAALQKAREKVSTQYRAGKSSAGLFHDPILLRSYLATRVPATFAACKAALHQLEIVPKTVLDMGAGPGTASWAALDVFGGIEKCYLIERELGAIAIGKELAAGTRLENASWTQANVEGMSAFPKVDLGILSYVVAEVGVDAIRWDKLFEACGALVVIEPGTPEGYSRILQIRQKLIALGAHILAPCPHQLKCPMTAGDWCHFGARVERSRLHRLMKEGSLGFEDEKFSYLAVSKISQPGKDRAIDPPQSGHGFIKLRLCTSDGSLKEKIITKKNREEYKIAKKLSWGEVYVSIQLGK